MRINGAKITALSSPDIDTLLEQLVVNGGGMPKANWEAIQELRANAKIPGTAGTWEEIDEEVIRAYEQEAKLVQDIRNQGLTANHDFGNLFSSYRVSSLMNDANVDMSGEEMGDEDRIEYNTRTVPVPVVHKEFRIGFRESENTDTSQDNIAEATRSVTRALEVMAWGGTDFTVEGNAINGVKDVGTSDDWGTTGSWTTPSNAYKEVIYALQTMRNNGYSAPFNLYVDQAYMDDLKGLRSNTTENYVDIIEGLEDINEIRFTNNAASDQAYMVSMTRRSLDMAVSQWITPVNWEMGPNGRSTQYQVFAIAVPRFKKDYAGNYGVYTNSDIS